MAKKAATIYVITRDCCLGPNCSRLHTPYQKYRVQQLRTANKELADKCLQKFNAAGYNAELESFKVKDIESAVQAYATPQLISIRGRTPLTHYGLTDARP